MAKTPSKGIQSGAHAPRPTLNLCRAPSRPGLCWDAACRAPSRAPCVVPQAALGFVGTQPWALLGRSLSKNAILCLECNALRARTAGDSLTGASSRSNPGARTGPRGLYAPPGKHFHVGCARDGTGIRIGTAAGGLWLGFRARIWLPGNLDPKISEPARPDSPAALPRGRPPRLQLRSVWRYAVSVLHPSGTHFHRTAV